MMNSHQPASYQEAETHFKQALHLYRKVEASRRTLSGTAALSLPRPGPRQASWLIRQRMRVFMP